MVKSLDSVVFKVVFAWWIWRSLLEDRPSEIGGTGKEGIPQGLKPLLPAVAERPKAEALGYLEATARANTTAGPPSTSLRAGSSGMTNKKGNNGKKQIPAG